MDARSEVLEKEMVKLAGDSWGRGHKDSWDGIRFAFTHCVEDRDKKQFSANDIIEILDTADKLCNTENSDSACSPK